MRPTARLRKLLEPPNSSRHHLDHDAQRAGHSVAPGARVLDAGAGLAPYRHHFAHTRYETADFAKLETPYAPDLDYVCDLARMPMLDGTYDLVFCSQVLEHIPEPVTVLREIRRVLKPGGQAWLSAPLFFEEHQQPYDFHRYTQFAWRRMAEQADFDVQELAWMEGYYGTLSYQLTMAVKSLGPAWIPIRALFLVLAHVFARLDTRVLITNRGMPKNYRCVLVARGSATSELDSQRDEPTP